MRRGTALLMGAVLMAAARLVPASGDTTPAPVPLLPKFLCTHGVVDPEADNAPQYVGGVDSTAAVPKRPALDIRGVYLRLTDSQLQVFMALAGDPSTAAMKDYESAWRYAVNFNIGTIQFNYGFERDNTADPGKDAKPSDAGQYKPKASMTGLIFIANSAAQFVPGTGTAPSWMVITSPRSEVEKQMGPIDGGTLVTNIAGVTQDYVLTDGASADITAASGKDAQYTIGDDTCFEPPPTSVTSLTAPAVVFNHSTKLSATLLDEAGKPLAGKPMTFTIQDGKPTKLSATTSADGVATATYLASVKGGSLPVTATFPGDSALKTSSVSGTIKVSAEKTAFTTPVVTKPTATTRVVAVKLLGDNKAAIVGALVDWYVNNKKVASVKTDKTGKASFRPKPGQTVQAKFAGKAGMLLPAVSRAVKV